MWLVSRTGVFTYFCFFFLLKDLETDNTKRRIRKTKHEIFKKVKDLIMMEKVINEDFEKASNSIKNPDDVVNVIDNTEKNIRSKKSNILWLAYQQGQIFEKFTKQMKIL